MMPGDVKRAPTTEELLATQRQRIAALEAALVKYRGHRRDCAAMNYHATQAPYGGCTCGSNDTMRELGLPLA
jgi:hypothetical protein